MKESLCPLAKETIGRDAECALQCPVKESAARMIRANNDAEQIEGQLRGGTGMGNILGALTETSSLPQDTNVQRRLEQVYDEIAAMNKLVEQGCLVSSQGQKISGN